MSDATIRSRSSEHVTEDSPEELREPSVSEDEVTCPECGGSLVADEEHAERVCSSCGLVVDSDRIDHGPDWRAFENGERTSKSRVGAPRTKMLHDEGMSTTIDWQDRDGYGNALSTRQRRKMQRLRTWDERFRTRDHQERNLKQALGEIDRMGSALGLPDDVRETASVIYRRALDEDLLPGRSIEGMSTAAVYAAARQGGSPRSIDEVSAVSRVDDMEFKRAYRYLVRELGLGIDLANPSDYVDRFGSDLGLPEETKRRARELLRTGEQHNVHVGKSPVGLAAAALYAAATLTGNGVTQSEVGDVAEVSEVTIRNRYQELLDAAEQEGTATA